MQTIRFRPATDRGSATVILILSLSATFVNGLGGGLTGVRARLDAFGVAALAVACGLGGSITRDLLIGTPAAAFRDWRYLAVLGVAGLVTLLAFPLLDRARRAIAVLDAAGLSLFAVTGASIALDHRLAAPEAVLLGAISGLGGVVLRDVLIREVPVVLRGGLSAISALVGASIVVIAVEAGRREVLFALLGAIACFSIRTAADRYNLNLPQLPYHARRKGDPGSSSKRDLQRERQPGIEPDGYILARTQANPPIHLKRCDARSPAHADPDRMAAEERAASGRKPRRDGVPVPSTDSRPIVMPPTTAESPPVSIAVSAAPNFSVLSNNSYDRSLDHDRI